MLMGPKEVSKVYHLGPPTVAIVRVFKLVLKVTRNPSPVTLYQPM